MGQLIVPRLMNAGHQVTGWNRSRDKAAPLIKAGMIWAETPRQAAEQSEIVFSIVTDAKAVRSVALGPDGIVSGIAKGGIFIDMSTIEPEESRAVAEEFEKAGAIMLDGPLSGSPVTVKAGNASIMIGGDEKAFERVEPVLLAIGPKVTRIGGNGLACQMKIAVNLLLMVEVVCFGEAVALAEKGGVERAVALDAILKSVAASPVLGYRGPFILEGAARRRHAAAEGYAVGAQSRPQTRQPGAARRRCQRDDECLPRSRHRCQRFRGRASSLSAAWRTRIRIGGQA